MPTGADSSDIRKRAEERVASDTSISHTTPEELVYELRVHQAELEMQNEELLRSERELQRSRREFETLFESAPIGYFVVNKDGTIRDVNVYGANLLQADRKYLYEKPFIVFIPRESHEQFFKHLQRVFDESRLQSLEMPILDRRGRRLWCRFESRIQVEDTGSARCFMAVIDVTDRKRVEDDLILAREDAVQGSRAKSLFLANMSHEIRTPMNAVMAMAELTRETELDEQQREWVDIIHNSATELTRIIGDVLDFSRIEAKQLTITPQPFDVQDIMGAVEATFGDAARDKGLTFSLEPEENLHRWYIGDQYRIRQVVYNLVSNAVKFTEHGSVTILLRTQEVSDHLRELMVEVRDTGIGIKESLQRSVFDSFYQADSGYAKHHQGTGLGLAISRQLAKLMSGQLYFESSEGEGSTFFFAVPLPMEEEAPADEPEPGPPDASPVEPPVPPAHQTGRVLVAEDNAINVLVMRTVLERAGYEVTTVADGAAALKELSENTYDIALMDISMPHISGIEATKRIRAGQVGAAGKSMPIVAITAHSMEGDREQFLSDGMDDYLAKPFSKQQMLRMVARILQQKEDANGG